MYIKVTATSEGGWVVRWNAFSGWRDDKMSSRPRPAPQVYELPRFSLAPVQAVLVAKVEYVSINFLAAGGAW